MKTQIQKLKSSKLFYNKWPYKVECIQHLASKAVYFGETGIEEWINGDRKVYLSESEKRILNKQDLLEFARAISPFIKNEKVKHRTEGRHFNLFCSDQTVLEEIDSRLYKWIRKISGPTTQEEYEFLMSNGHKKVLCDALPKNGYKFKVFFKSNFSKDKRKSFLDWTSNYGDKIILSGTTKRWLAGEKFYVQDPFMYVKDEKMLSMIGIYLSGYVKKVEEFIERNTALVA
jgi:hypothetical protein